MLQVEGPQDGQVEAACWRIKSGWGKGEMIQEKVVKKERQNTQRVIVSPP
jgi:hypothetical protein